jgi:DNA-directed RNA polymerase
VRERDENKIDRKKSRSGISPNIIHSFDSSHLMSTVLYCQKENINDFFLIHDSFATTINDTSKLYGCVREAFIDMYKNYCLYTDIQDQIRQQLNNPNTDKLEEIPKKGNLNLDEIRNSAYCFS